MKKEHKCVSCGIIVMRYDCQLKKSANVFCSTACVGFHKKNGCDVTCQNCGKSFYRRFGEQDLEIRESQYCSKECYFSARDHGKSYKRIKDRHLHRIVAEAKIGLDLLPGEVVHHKDGNIRNNHPSNLQVLSSQAEHVRIHFTKPKTNQ